MNILAISAVLTGNPRRSGCATFSLVEAAPGERPRRPESGRVAPAIKPRVRPRFLPGLCVLLLSACAANGPVFDEAAFDAAAIPGGKARLVFFRTRDSALYVARQAALSMNGDKTAGLGYGSFIFRDVEAADHALRADMWDMPGRCELILTAAAGETYYFQVDPRTESFGAFASGDIASQLLSSNLFINIAGGVGAVAAESYGKACGGAFRIYPVDAGTARARLASLWRAD